MACIAIFNKLACSLAFQNIWKYRKKYYLLKFERSRKNSLTCWSFALFLFWSCQRWDYTTIQFLIQLKKYFGFINHIDELILFHYGFFLVDFLFLLLYTLIVGKHINGIQTGLIMSNVSRKNKKEKRIRLPAEYTEGTLHFQDRSGLESLLWQWRKALYRWNLFSGLLRPLWDQ